MFPAIKLGSAVIIESAESYKIGEVITYLPDLTKPKDSVTHRIMEVKNEGQEVGFVTKGDANQTQDRELVPKRAVLGKVIFSVPFVGVILSFSKTQAGFILLVIVPATLIVYSELLTIKNQTKKLFEERKKKKLSVIGKTKNAIGKELMEVGKGLEEEKEGIEKKLTQKPKKATQKRMINAKIKNRKNKKV